MRTRANQILVGQFILLPNRESLGQFLVVGVAIGRDKVFLDLTSENGQKVQVSLKIKAIICAKGSAA